MDGIKKIDIHAHANIFPQYFPRFPWGAKMCDVNEMLDFYEKLNIEKGVLLAISSPEGQVTTQPSEICKYVADMYPDRFLWFCNVDPRAAENNANCDLEYL